MIFDGGQCGRRTHQLQPFSPLIFIFLTIFLQHSIKFNVCAEICDKFDNMEVNVDMLSLDMENRHRPAVIVSKYGRIKVSPEPT